MIKKTFLYLLLFCVMLSSAFALVNIVIPQPSSGGGSGNITQYWSNVGNLLYPTTISNAVSIGTNNSTTMLDVMGALETYTIGDVSTFTATQISGSTYFANGYSYNFLIVAYRTINGVTVYSLTGAGASLTDDGSANTYDIELSWDAVPDADGYKILIEDPNMGYYYDFSITSASSPTNYYYYAGSYDSIITPQSGYTYQFPSINATGDATINGQLTNYRIESNNNDPLKTPMVIRNSNGDKIFELLDGGEIAYGGNAESGPFDPNWKVEADRIIQFAKFINNNPSGRTIMGVGMGATGGGATFDLRAHGSSYSETLFGNNLIDATAMIAQGGLGFVIGNYENQPLIFGTNNAERGRINGTGLWGMGTNDPRAMIHSQRTGEQLRLSQSATSYVTHNVSTTTGILTYDAFGTTPEFQFRDNVSVNGTLNATFFQVNGTLGLTKTVSLRNASNNASCTIIFTSGLYTGGTC